jgi:DNA gyrase subunit A
MIRMAVSDMRRIGRATQGVRLINLDEGDKLVAATTTEPDDEALSDREPPVALPPDATGLYTPGADNGNAGDNAEGDEPAGPAR